MILPFHKDIYAFDANVKKIIAGQYEPEIAKEIIKFVKKNIPSGTGYYSKITFSFWDLKRFFNFFNPNKLTTDQGDVDEGQDENKKKTISKISGKDRVKVGNFFISFQDEDESREGLITFQKWFAATEETQGSREVPSEYYLSYCDDYPTEFGVYVEEELSLLFGLVMITTTGRELLKEFDKEK